MSKEGFKKRVLKVHRHPVHPFRGDILRKEMDKLIQGLFGVMTGNLVIRAQLAQFRIIHGTVCLNNGAARMETAA